MIAQIEWTVPPAAPARSPAGLPGKRPVRDARSAGNGSLPTVIGARHLDGEPQPAQTITGETAAASPVVPVPETQAPPTPDRGQILAANLSRCERENAVVGFLCKERARLQYCEGHWGEAPQCPTVALNNDRR